MSKSTESIERRNFLQKGLAFLLNQRELFLAALIGIMILGITHITPYFLTAINMRNLALAISFNSIVVIGMTVLMIGGGIDLSIGATYGLASIIAGMWISNGLPILPALFFGILIGAAVGWFNGILINKYLLSPFLATLGTMTLFRGLIWVISSGQSIVGLPKAFTVFGQTKIFDIQMPVFIMITFIIMFDFLLRRSIFFRQMYYIGINRGSAVFVGINANRVTGIAYVLSGVLAAFAGLLDGSRLGAIYIQAGTGLEFQVITASVIGGTLLKGGKGTIFGSFLGVIIMAILTNVFNLIGVSIYWQNVFVGIILVVVVVIDSVITPKEAR